MKRIAKTLGLGTILLLAAAACSKENEGPDKAGKAVASKTPAGDSSNARTAPSSSPRAAVATTSLQTYTNAELGFAVDAPKRPKQADMTAPSEAGALKLKTFDFAPPGTAGGLVISVNPMPADREIDLDGARDGALKSMGGTLVSSQEVELGGHPGRAFRFRVAAQRIAGYVRLYERDHMLYQVLMAHLEGDRKLQQTGEQFVDSFRFVDMK